MSRILTKDGKVWPDWKLQPPPEGSPGVGPWVYERYQTMRRHRDRQGLVELWQHNHELLRGRIFKVRSKLSQTIANLFFKIHNSLKANLTDSKPKASIMPNGQTPDGIADAWQARYDSWWEARQQQRCLQESVGLTELYGYQTDHMRFNPDLEGGLGEIETHRLGTYSYLSWPGHVDIQTAPGLCIYEAMELGEIYDRWPEAEDKVKADPDFSDMGEERAWVRGNRSRNLRPMGSATGYVIPGEEGTGAEARGGTQRALVIQMWIKDYTMHWVDPRTGEPCKKTAELWEDTVDPETGQPVMEPMIDDATGLPVFTEDGQPALVQSRQRIEPEEWSKYPGFIRCIYVAGKNGDYVLEDVPNPSINPDLPREMTSQSYLWDKFPFIKRLSYSDDISEYGLCVFEQIETLVIEICKKLTQYGVHLERTCRNPLILPQGCGVKNSQTNNLPARIWEPVAGLAQQIRFLEVPQTPNDLLAFIELCIRLVDMVTGITEVSEGRRPTGVTAGVAIAELQEKAQVAYRIKIRNNDTYLEEQGRMFISLGQNWYTNQEYLRYEGKGSEQMLAFRGIDYQGDLAFHMEAGSTLPRNRGVRQQQVLEMAKSRPNFPNKVLLNELSIPNADEVAAQMDAGPLGMAMQKLQQSGLIPEEVLQTIDNLMKMDDKTFNQNFGSGNPLDVAGGQG